MKKSLLTACVFLCAFGGSAMAVQAGNGNLDSGGSGSQRAVLSLNTPNTPASRDSACEAQIAALLAEFPKGGPGLRAAITRAVEEDPSLAHAVVTCARDANPAQQLAMGEGLADADLFFARLNTPEAIRAQQLIETAMASAPQGVLAGFAFAGGNAVPQPIPGVGNAGLTTNACVSPSEPGLRCR